MMPSTAPQTMTAGTRPRTRWWVLAVVALAQLMVVIDATIVNIALPSAQRDLGFPDADRQWVVTAYSLAFGSLLLLGGRLADLLGHRLLLLTGVAGFAGASALAGAADSFPLLIAGRVLQGLFGALLAPAALSLLTITFTHPKERARAFGVFGAVAGTGGAIGLLLGGLLTEHLSWRWTLYINVGLAALALLGGLTLLRGASRKGAAHLDIIGTLLVCAGLFCLVYGLSQAEGHAWSAPSTWGFLVAGAGLIALFTAWQACAEHPLLPLRIITDRGRAASFIAVAVSMAGMFGLFLFLTYYLQTTLGFRPFTTGLAFLPMIAALAGSAQVATNLTVRRYGTRAAVLAGLVVAALGLILLTRIGPTDTYSGHVLLPLLVIGLGMGHVMPPAMNQATAGIAETDSGAASAAVNTMQQIGGSLGIALLNTLATGVVTHDLGGRRPSPAQVARAQVHGYTTAFWWAAGILAVGLVGIALLYPGASRVPETAHGGRAPL